MSGDIGGSDMSGQNFILDEVAVHFDVLSAVMKDGILGNV